MTWIRVISYPESTGKLRRLYDRVKGPGDNVDNIMAAHSLRPHTMEGHMALYKRVLHHADNAIEPWFLEALGVYTSLLNDCPYCVEHHMAGLGRWVDDAGRTSLIREALESGGIDMAFDARERSALDYARRLTEVPSDVRTSDIDSMRSAGWSDGEILEVNQVVAYFNYANRMVLGLGVTADGDVLGLSPGNRADTDDWNHG